MQPENPPLTRTQVLAAIALTALALVVLGTTWMRLLRVAPVPWRFSLGLVGEGLALGGAIALAGAGLYLGWERYRRAADSYLARVLTPLRPGDEIWLGLLPGLSEEFLFRGVALPGLGNGALALILSSSIFGLLHWAERRQWPYSLWAIAVGFGFGAVTLTTGSLVPAIVAHVTANTLAGYVWRTRGPDRNQGEN
ncbi:MAG: CPBP family intramembrane metalloprotease [Oscillatoriales cyanobacterium SM2_1_8]|nr:CPBP family intramembrane metalloprotease [Oscillatoriales cyanobacterium SM2_1_8]